MKRLKDVDGLPKVQQKTPQDFFSDIEREDTGSLCRWRGELYLELHNGTYTTHAKVSLLLALLILCLNVVNLCLKNLLLFVEYSQ